MSLISSFCSELVLWTLFFLGRIQPQPFSYDDSS